MRGAYVRGTFVRYAALWKWDGSLAGKLLPSLMCQPGSWALELVPAQIQTNCSLRRQMSLMGNFYDTPLGKLNTHLCLYIKKKLKM